MSALLRLPEGTSPEERARRVEEVIKVLHLTRAAKTKVGDSLNKGISGGERKRTSIAMEVVPNPAMLFLDEPTSGLDTFTAFAVIKAMQNMAHRQGRTIVSTIHQPSSDIFYLFDDLMVLAEGKVVYYGTVEGSIGYFGRMGFGCPEYSNPADYFFMSILSNNEGSSSAIESDTTVSDTQKETSEARLARLIDSWPKSPEHAQMLHVMTLESSKSVSQLSYKGHASYLTQFRFLTGRASKNAIRNPSIVLLRVIQSLFVGVLLGLVYMDQSQYDPDAQIQNISGVLAFITINLYFSAADMVMATFYEEKPVFYREYVAGYYRLSAYYWTKIICEVFLVTKLAFKSSL